MPKKTAFLGIDLGTTGIRALMSDESGNVLEAQSAGVEKSFVKSRDPVCSEQDPHFWESPLFQVLGKILSSNEQYYIKAITCDSTSGTIIPIDSTYKPLYNAILHNDARAQNEASFICKNTKLAVKPSFALSKILWIKNNRRELYDKTYKFIHAADYIKGLISGDFDTTDFSNAVKTGYDLNTYKWPDSMDEVLGISCGKLPAVVKTGEVVAELKKSIREEFCIKNKVRIVAGATDSTTSFYSSGARMIGDWNTTLGTVLAMKGIAGKFIEDPDNLLYAHRHPEGFWLPGAASNTGGESLRLFFGKDLDKYDKRIEDMPPTGGLVYPLVRKSEKLPFLNPDAFGFINMPVCNPLYMFKGFLEGLSFVERMIYEKIENIGYKVGNKIFSMGGGALSKPWMRIRANILKKIVYRTKVVETAFGAALIAAGAVYYKSLTEAIENMVKIDCFFEPDGKICALYDEIYERFISECRKRGLF